MNFAKWLKEVENYSWTKFTWFILENLDDNELKNYWQEYKNPSDFVEWQAEKYDIQRTDLPYC